MMARGTSASRIFRLFMMVIALASLHSVRRVVTSQSGSSVLAAAAATSSGSSSHRPWGLVAHKHPKITSPKSYKLVQCVVIHRHGDRTPITPLKNETYWASALPSDEILSKVSQNTNLVRDENQIPNNHLAGGRGPFGQLSQLGLLQMVELGNKLREQLFLEEPLEDEHHVDKHGNRFIHHGRLFHRDHPLHPRHVQIQSTDFPRTIQSVQGVLVGLFPDPIPENTLHIDVRHTSTMIPDPQPRRTKEQEDLERILAARPHLKQRESEMKDLAVRATDALRPLLADGAYEVSFGVGEESVDSDKHLKPLAWTQLSEITKCLQVRDLLPPEITETDQEAISNHAAWKWTENLCHPRLAYLAMNPMASQIVNSMRRRINGEDEPVLQIFSAHDSTLIGLLCAFRLSPPKVWPEYGSYLKLELIEVGSLLAPHEESGNKEYFVRFSLNGEVLHSKWDPENDAEPLEVIELDTLYDKITTEGASPLRR